MLSQLKSEIVEGKKKSIQVSKSQLYTHTKIKRSDFKKELTNDFIAACNQHPNETDSRELFLKKNLGNQDFVSEETKQCE